jgi:hypothetical protein
MAVKKEFALISALSMVFVLGACGASPKKNDVWNNYDSHRTVATEGNASDNDSSYSQPHGFGMCTSAQSFGCE